MAERKAVNKYYPPDWDPSKGSLNKYRGEHALRDRARKLDQGILIIRFEMPFNIWCTNCQAHIGMGVRYNAEKKRIGDYFSTPIYSFRMKCRACAASWIEIHTDPKNSQYVVVGGATRKNESWSAASSETIELKDDREAEKLALNSFYKLEYETADRTRARVHLPVLEKLQAKQEAIWKDDFKSNQLARSTLRTAKKEHEARVKIADELRLKSSLQIPMVEERIEDVEVSRSIPFKRDSSLTPVSIVQSLKKRRVIKQ